MDYENKHKEEIIRATQLWECGDISRENLEYIFPELAESEDERMKKGILRILYSLGAANNREYIDWLEKQGKKQASAVRWYDTSLTPEEMRELLVEWDSEDATWHEVAFYHADTKTFWDGERQVENVTRWCYIDDILEKQGETVMETIPIESNPQVACPYCKNTNCAYIDGHWFCANCHREFYLGWSEEDDGMVACIKSHLRQILTPESYTSYRRWLESLKQRMEK